MGIGKTITGIILVAIGTVLILTTNIVGIIYGPIIIIIGITFLLFPNEENKIEQRKDLNTKKTQK
jgi:cytochrome c biogenesis protein CcdA